MALTHDLLYICPPTPLQHAMVAGLALDENYYQNMREAFLKKRDKIQAALREVGFKITSPQGAYYLMADCSTLGYGNSDTVANKLLEEAAVA